MFKNHILVCFLVVGLHLCLVVEVVYVHVCGKMVCCCVLGFWFSSFTDGNNILITERSWWTFCS